MGCELIGQRISDYYFGAVSGADRAAVEAHLLDCRTCLEEFLFLKSAVETGAELGELPGPAARDRLFEAVAATVAGAGRTRAVWHAGPRGWRGGAWLAAGMAMVLGAGGLFYFLHDRALSERPVIAFHQVDTADTEQAEPVSFNVF